MVVPKGALYGKDCWGTWVCIHKELYPMDTPTLELYRWNNEEMGWVLTIEHSDTVNSIVNYANKFNLWDLPIEYPKYTGIHNISANMDKTISRRKCNTLKRTAQRHEKRHDHEQVALDVWEKVVSHVR